MKLPFMTKWADGTPTYFIPKIWKSIWEKKSTEFIKYTKNTY